MKRRGFLMVVVIVIIFFLSSATTKVLIIGVGKFDDERIIALPGAITDANTFQKTILDTGITKPENITLLENPSLGKFLAALERFFTMAEPQDRLILYYSGHGYAKDDRTYLIPSDADSDFIEITAYNLTNNLARLLSLTKAEDIVLIIDACYAGSIVRSRMLREIRIELHSLEDIIKQTGAVLMLSSGPTEVSLERATGGGWFTYYLIRGLRGEAGKGKEWITTNDIFEYVKQNVSRQTNGKQNPVLIGQKEIPLVWVPGIKGTCILKILAGNELSKTGTVYLNGEEKGKLENGMLSILNIIKGEHTVLVDGEKIERWERQIEFRNDNEMQEIRVEARPATRTIRIITEPVSGAKVLLNGREVGTSPWQGNIEIGQTVVVKVVYEGYKIEEQKINITSKGEMIELKMQLRKNIPPETPKLLEPANNAQNVPLETVLRWQKSEDPEGDEVTYDIYLGTSGNMKLLVEDFKGLEYLVKNLEAGKTYEWKVVSKDTNGGRAESKSQKFSTILAPGTMIWQFLTNSRIRSSPAIGSDGTIYVGSDDTNIYAISSDGKLKWKFQTGKEIFSSPAIGSDGTIYVGSWDNNLYAITSDGKLKWKFQTGNWISSSPAIASDGTIYIGSNDKYIYAINPDGTLKWKFQTEGNISSSPAIGADGTIYVGSWDSYLYAISPDGKLKWKFQTGGNISSSPAIGTDGTIYVGSWDKNLYAIGVDGKLKWKFQTGNWVDSSPAIGLNGVIYVGSDGLYAITSDGKLKWKFQTNNWMDSSPAIGADGTVYIGSKDNYLYAISADGKLKWKFQRNGSIDSSPAIGKDGIIYVGSNDGGLYAISGDSKGLFNSSWPKFRGNNCNTGRLGDN